MPDRLYYFETTRGIIELTAAIDLLFTPEEMAGILEKRKDDPTFIGIPVVLFTGAIGRGKLISSSIMIREYLKKRRAGDYVYKMYAMWRLLCREAGYKPPTYNWFRLLVYRLRRLNLIYLRSKIIMKPDTMSVPPVTDTKYYYALTKFGLGTYKYDTGEVDELGRPIMSDAIDEMWRNPGIALYMPKIQFRKAAAKYLTPEQIESIRWPP